MTFAIPDQDPMGAAPSRSASCATDAPATRPASETVADILIHEHVNAEYRYLVLGCEGPALTAAPGQFFSLLCPPSPGAAPFLRRPMSLYGVDPAQGQVSFLYKVAGAGTRGLATLKVGETCNIVGPLGQGFTLDPAWRHIVVVGRGVGLATLAPLATAAKAHGIAVTAILSTRRADLVMSVELFEAAGASVIVVSDEDGTSGPGHVERVLRDVAQASRPDALFTCGSNRLMLLLQRFGRELGIPGQVALEQQMACGLGMCFCCVRDFKAGDAIVHRRVCWDGPVFDLQEALPWSI